MSLSTHLKRIGALRTVVHRLRTLNPHEFAFPAGHYHSPLPALKELRVRQASIWGEPPPSTLPGIDTNVAGQLAELARLAPYAAAFPFPSQPRSGWRYDYSNDYFVRQDGLVLYSLLHTLRPRRLIEVGSGYSSALVLDTNERMLDGQIACTFIEPYPERLLSLITPKDQERITLLRQPVQDVPLATFEALAANDILFIDSGHVSKTGSDVNWLVFQVLPCLASGVYVHFHDILWPFEYPKKWALKGRAWNEAYLVRALLQNNPVWEIALWPHFLSLFYPELVQEALPGYPDRKRGSSLWLRKR